jgi:hypothetical protein
MLSGFAEITRVQKQTIGNYVSIPHNMTEIMRNQPIFIEKMDQNVLICGRIILFACYGSLEQAYGVISVYIE